MKIFVTVGSTHFNSLIKAVDDYIDNEHHDVTCQIADGNYIPKNHQYFKFTNDIEQYFAEADIVISHAGAGTVFYLLECTKKMIVVPNCERVDNHQLDLAEYVEQGLFANVCFELPLLAASLDKVQATEYKPYINEIFSGYQTIYSLFNNSYGSCVGGIPMNVFHSMDDAVEDIISANGRVIFGSAIAINPEKVINFQKNEKTRDAIMSAKIRYADGIGVVKTLIRKTGEDLVRIPGCELWEALMVRAGKMNIPVYLIGASPKVNRKTRIKLKQLYDVNLVGYQDGYFNEEEEELLIENICISKPSIITVALGSPRQELFINKCQKLYPDAFYMGVGGTYDVFTKQVKRAPLLYRQLNLEWLYRLISQPKRILRQKNLLVYLYKDITRQL